MENIHQQKSRMIVVYRKKESATRKGKNFLHWRAKCVMIGCSYQNYVTKYLKFHCVGFVPARKGLEKYCDLKYKMSAGEKAEGSLEGQNI